MFWLDKNINSWLAFFVLTVLSLTVGFWVIVSVENFQPEAAKIVKVEKRKQANATVLFPQPAPPPSPPDIEKMKTQGCVADGLLSGWGGNTNDIVKVVNRSDCYYLHRALETWANHPDFESAKKIKAKIDKTDIIYGMFIAEAINTKTLYSDEDRSERFNFEKMCKDGMEDFWKKNVCIPSFESKEYRKYLKYITEKAMDMGIQSFLFGQVFYQENNNLSNAWAPEIILQMKEYADSKGMKIVVGAQTNDITDEKYLKNFDFIDGGVGLRADGSIEDGPCFSRWWKKPGDWCWALLWNKLFAKNANNVFLHLDWGPKVGDDMSTFARMSDAMREKTLRDLHLFFTTQNKGFMLPILAVLPTENGGCYGAKKSFYSPSKKYSCDDEEVINDILKEAKKKAQFDKTYPVARL
ncbi:MAG: hypothetical protein ACD_11C00145G0027 [uncultured bacterium]|nr:MAG: hypothetical protein ACD_11C00145G0027 [uncultured bacterium]HBR71883.1 hypothetical protein [Candidatus Moranbacteria bacterium]